MSDIPKIVATNYSDLATLEMVSCHMNTSLQAVTVKKIDMGSQSLGFVGFSLGHDGGSTGDDIVLTTPEIKICYRYPLQVPCVRTHHMAAGWTRSQLCERIQADYHAIYAEEEAAVGPTDTIPGMQNRAQSAGPHEIWGHYLEDLYLESVRLCRDGICYLEVSS